LNDTNYQQTQKFIEELANHIPDINVANHFRRTFLEANVTSLN
jgi:hypothetical protein